MSVNVRIRNGLEPNTGSGGATEGDLRGDFSDIIDVIGVMDLAGGHLLVHEAGSPAMTVVVDAGVGYIPNNSYDELDSDSVKFWEAVVAGTAGSRTLAIAPNSSGSTRIDLVCLKIDAGATPDEFASDIAELIIVEGTPGAGAPALPNFHLQLATVTVANGATEILDEDIADDRVQSTLKTSYMQDIPEAQVVMNGSGHGHTGGADGKLIPKNRAYGFYIAGTQSVANDLSWNPRIYSVQTATRISIHAKTAPTGANLIARVYNITQAEEVASITLIAGNTDATSNTITNASLAAGDILRIDVTQKGSSVAGTDISVTLDVTE